MAASASTQLPQGGALRLPAALQWALAAFVFGFAVVLAFTRFDLHVTASSVLTGSMRPAFAPGDAVITRPIPITAVRPGMVILATPEGGSTPYAHRVIAVKHENGQVFVRTQGDANPSPDAWLDVYAPTSQVAAVIGSVPKLGYLLEAVRGHTTQRGVVPVAVAGLVLTFVACAFVLLAGRPRPNHLETAL